MEVEEKEGESRMERPRDHETGYIHYRNVKKGVERLERRPGRGYLGDPKKGGHGGKFTWAGPSEEASPAALDPSDPNYVDDSEEAAAAVEAPLVVGEVEVPKTAPQGIARIEVRAKECQ